MVKLDIEFKEEWMTREDAFSRYGLLFGSYPEVSNCRVLVITGKYNDITCREIVSDLSYILSKGGVVQLHKDKIIHDIRRKVFIV